MLLKELDLPLHLFSFCFAVIFVFFALASLSSFTSRLLVSTLPTLLQSSTRALAWDCVVASSVWCKSPDCSSFCPFTFLPCQQPRTRTCHLPNPQFQRTFHSTTSLDIDFPHQHLHLCSREAAVAVQGGIIRYAHS